MIEIDDQIWKAFYTSFERIPVAVDGVTYFVPSNQMIFEILHIISPVDWRHLRDKSNEWVSNFEQTISHQNCQQRLAIWKSICVTTGFSFTSVQKALYETWWYSIVDSGSSSTEARYSNSVDLLRISGKALDGDISVDEKLSKLRSGVEDRLRKDRTNTFPCHESAWLLIDSALKIAVKQSRNDLTLRLLLSALLENIAENNRQMKYAGRFLEKLTTFCPFCGELIEFGGKIRPSHCGQPECEREYNRKIKQVQRFNQKVLTAWVKGFDTPRRCKGCKKQRNINSEGFCKECHSESLAQQ